MRSVATIGRWSTRRPWRAIAAWLAFVAVAVAAMAATGTDSLQNGAVGESARGYALIEKHLAGPPDREYGYVHSATLRAEDDEFQGAALDVAAAIRKELGGEPRFRRSADHHSVLVVAQVTRPFSLDALHEAVQAAARGHPQVTVGETGDESASDARDRVVNRDLHRAELLSVPVTLLVLLFAFGAIVAALVPVLLALTAVAAAFGLLGPISQAFPLDDAVKTVVLLIGMAVGVDYALFYVIRSREERLRGVPPHEALERTARTSGRTVLVSGTTVIIAMAGQFVIGSDNFNGVASGTIAVVACAVAGSVTVLPAVLDLLGARIDRGRIPYLPHLRTEGGSRFWPAIVDRVLRRPVVSCALAAGLLVALAVPAFWLHVSKPSDESLSSQHEPALATLARVRHDFPGTSAPAIVVVAGRAASRRAPPPFTLNGRADGRAASIELPLTGAGDNPASRRAIEILRDELVPQTLGRVPGAETAVTGVTAEDVLGFHSNGAIISWLPLFLFVVLFGLSMDYHVFILSRVREAVDAGMPTDEAVRHGITVTAGVVTSAALVMVAVFSLFGSLSSLELKQAGVGLATAVLIDATVVRAVLLPASMKLLGEWNWYLPRALRRLPRAGIEAPAARDPV